MALYKFTDIYNIATALTKDVPCPHLRDDLRQEFCMGALLGMERVIQEEGARSYVWKYGWGRMLKFWRRHNRATGQASVSLQQLTHDGDSGYEALSETLTDEGDKTPLDMAEMSDLSDITKELLSHTTRQRRWVLYYRYIRREPMTYKEIGKRLGFSKQWATQVEQQGLKDLKHWMVWNLRQLKKDYEDNIDDDTQYIENEDMWRKVDGMWGEYE